MHVLIRVDPNSGVPVFRQLMDQIRFQASSGLLAPGAELPSTRALSEELGINPMTVSKAYALLEAEGVLVRRPGLPHVVREQGGDALERTREEQLRAALQSAAVIARQLGMSATKAAGVFRRMLDDNDGETK
jgi:GntR family transcriptional regulator